MPGKTFRHIAYDNYKAGRAKADDALIMQLKNSRSIFEAFNIPVYDSPSFEADDIIGTICEKYKKDESLNIIIASGDMDTMQLVNDKKVRVYTLKKGINDTILYDEAAVLARFGFKPSLLPDYKGLRGDPSDNIKGIKGIGEKTATILIATFGAIEEIYKQLRITNYELQFKKLGFSDRIIRLLKDNEEEALFSKTLAQIRTDAPINFILPEKTFWEKADLKKIEQIFSLFEFRSLFGRLKSFFNNQKLHTKNSLEGTLGRSGGDGQRKFSAENFRGESERILPREVSDPAKLQETSIALWLINSDISNPQLDDILMFANTDSFQTASEYIFKQLK